MSKKSNITQIVLFLFFIFSFFILNLILPDKEFSERENKELAQLPKLTSSSLFSGDFTKKFEAYTTDQFAFRDDWTTMKARLEICSGKKENKGVYLCSGGNLIEKYTKPDSSQLNTNINAVKTLVENTDVPVYFALIPSASEIYPDLLPKDAPNDREKEIIDYCYTNSGAKNIDIYNTMLEHKDEYIYYRTDHHWTSLGAYYGYDTLMKEMGLIPTPLSEFNRHVVTEDFYGTVYSKSGISWVRPDSIEIFADQQKATQVMNYPNNEPIQGTMYDYSCLENKDKYKMFMGGNTPLLKVTTDKKDAPKVLIIRDSYMDSVTPMLQNNFSEIHIMDLRYYKTNLINKTVADYIKENNIDQVLVCYSINVFGTDNNIFLLR